MKTKIYRFATFLFISLLMISCVSEEASSSGGKENAILAFSINKGDISIPLNILDNSITGNIPGDFDLRGISLEVLISDGAKISPDPETIDAINGPLTFIVTSANGKERTYNVSVNKEQSAENSILEFNITTAYLSTNAKIDQETAIVTKRLPAFIDLANLNIDLKYSEGASISPNPATITDYSSPVNFTVTSQSGVQKVYQVKLEHMDVTKISSCSDANAWKWFGGDNRTNAPDILPYDRNIGTGQAIVLSNDLTPLSFSVHFREGFRYFEDFSDYRKAVTLKLIIKDQVGETVATTTTNVSEQFTGGFVPFNLEPLHLFLEAGKTYVFFWYLVDGAALGVTASSSGNTDNGSGFCFNSGYAGESSLSTNTNLEQPSAWYQHGWHFNIELEGKE